MNIEFKRYLQKAGHTPSTIKTYLFANRKFTNDNNNAEILTYRDVVSYLSSVTRNGISNGKKAYLLYGMKKYFDFLIETGMRDNHPCRNLNLRSFDRKNIIHQDLFSSAELELLLTRDDRYSNLALRNKVLMSLLIYQGLTSAEVVVLNESHISLYRRNILIKSSKRINRRFLPMTQLQIELFEDYLSNGREKLLRRDNEAFVLSKLGNRICVDDIHYLISTYKGLFPDRKLTAVTIRQSVIANWLNEQKIPLERVQQISGQKLISTTLRYRQINLQEQKELMDKWFPLK